MRTLEEMAKTKLLGVSAIEALREVVSDLIAHIQQQAKQIETLKRDVDALDSERVSLIERVETLEATSAKRDPLDRPAVKVGAAPVRIATATPARELWVDDADGRCGNVSPDNDHCCTMAKDHGGLLHVAIDPVFGNPLAVWWMSAGTVQTPGRGTE